MSLTSSIISALLGAIAGGVVSYIVSSKIAREQMDAKYALQNKRERREWYKRASEFSELTISDWYTVVNRGEVDHEINATEKFEARRDDLRQHAAVGRSLDVDHEIVSKLEDGASNLSVALTKMDSGGELADIERELHATLSRAQQASKEKVSELS